MADTAAAGDLAFSPAGMERYEWLLTRYPVKDAALLPALRIAEKEFGSLGPEELRYVADLMGLPPAKVLGVFTFYTHFRRKGTGRYHFQVCSTLSCALRGSQDVVKHLEERLDIRVGETSEDGLFTVSKVECLASCDTAPMLQLNDGYHEGLTIEDVDRIVDQCIAEAKKNGGTS